MQQLALGLHGRRLTAGVGVWLLTAKRNVLHASKCLGGLHLHGKAGCKTAGEARLVQWVGNLQATAATDAWDLPETDASDRKQVLSS